MSADRYAQVVRGIKPAYEVWINMKAIWDAYRALGKEPPREVWEYFDDAEPDANGVVIELAGYAGSDGYEPFHPCVTRFEERSHLGYRIDLSQIPEGVKELVFYQDWS